MPGGWLPQALGFHGLILLSFALSFALAFGISRLFLLALRSYRREWYAILGVHLLTVVIAFAIGQDVRDAVASLGGFVFFITFTQGDVIYLQGLLLAADFAHAWLVRRAPVLGAVHLSHGRLLAAAAALAVLAFAVAYALARPFGYVVEAAIDPLIERQMAHAISTDPETKRLAAAFQQAFPEDYRATLDRFRASLKPLLRDRHRYADRLSWFRHDLAAAAQHVTKAHGSDIAHAPDGDLVAIAQSNAALAAAYSGLPTLCAVMLVGVPALRDPNWNRPAGADVNRIATDLQIAMLRAARHGIDHLVIRAAVAPSASAALLVALRKRLPPAAVAKLGDLSALKAATPREQCDVQLAMTGAMASLPPDQTAPRSSPTPSLISRTDERSPSRRCIERAGCAATLW